MTESYRQKVLQTIISALEPMPDVLAAWEGGSIANGSADQYSDIDLSIYSKTPMPEILERVEVALAPFQVMHAWRENKSAWGPGMLQRMLILKDSPEFFYVDVATFDGSNPKIIADFFEIERHGNPVVHFDKNNIVKLTHTDPVALFERQKARLTEIKQVFPIYKTLVLKEIKRGKAIDAFAFYQNGLLRPLVEVLGMIHRPYKFDFGLRYLHKQFPAVVSELIQDLIYVPDLNSLPTKLAKLEEAFTQAVTKAQAKESL